MSTTTVPARCPRCRAGVAPGTAWCLLCFEPFAPAAPEHPAPARAALPAAGEPDRGDVEERAREMLAALAASGRPDPLSALVGPAGRLPTGRGGRVALTAGLLVLVAVALVLAMAALGAVLG